MHRKISLLIVAGLLQGSLIQAGDLPEPPAEDPTFKVPPKDGKCRAVALRGGGTKGAYEVGVLKGMVELMKPLEYAYDVIVGVSCGGINAGILATFSRGFEKVAVDFLWEMWANLPVTDLWQNWTLGPFEAIWRSSFVDN
jgi:predicted acylesterase/phospholipase RssA